MLADRPVDHQQKLNLRWTFSNGLSALRLALAVPASLTLWASMGGVTIALFVLAALTDILDGYLARRLDEVSDLGKILDPLADKVFVAVIVVVMLLKGLLPLWFVGIVIARDLLILFGGIVVERKTGAVLPSNYPGKIAVLVLSTTLLLIVADAGWTTVRVMEGLSLALLALSFVLYAVRGVRAFRRGSVAA